MFARQRESRRVVIEGCRLPGSRSVAGEAIVTEVCRDVVWVRRALIISLMTGVAIRVRELIIVVLMTRLTL